MLGCPSALDSQYDSKCKGGRSLNADVYETAIMPLKLFALSVISLCSWQVYYMYMTGMKVFEQGKRTDKGDYSYCQAPSSGSQTFNTRI